jgi:AcrR family transcriptional regulator
MTRLTADDWIDAAREIVAASGIAAVAVEPLARALGVTKGSFYWHFSDRGALLTAVLERWERDGTEAPIAAGEQLADPRERLRRLIEEAFSDELGTNRDFHLALLDAGRDPLVEPVLRRVTARRLGHLRACYRALGFDARTARLWALQAYATYLGTLRLRRDLPEYAPHGRLDAAYRRHLTTTLMPDLQLS